MTRSRQPLVPRRRTCLTAWWRWRWRSDRAQSREWSTVLLAKGVPHWTAEMDEGVAVFVPEEQEELALSQLVAYDREQRQEARGAAKVTAASTGGSGVGVAGVGVCGGSVVGGALVARDVGGRIGPSVVTRRGADF